MFTPRAMFTPWESHAMEPRDARDGGQAEEERGEGGSAENTEDEEEEETDDDDDDDDEGDEEDQEEDGSEDGAEDAIRDDSDVNLAAMRSLKASRSGKGMVSFADRRRGSAEDGEEGYGDGDGDGDGEGEGDDGYNEEAEQREKLDQEVIQAHGRVDFFLCPYHTVLSLLSLRVLLAPLSPRSPRSSLSAFSSLPLLSPSQPSMYERVKHMGELTDNFKNLFFFLCYTCLYLTVLYLQADASICYQVTTAHNVLLPPDYMAAASMTMNSPDDFYTWLNDSIIQVVWKDPPCGNGICERPLEFEAFGRFGCSADCGDLAAVTSVTVHLTTDFHSPTDAAASSWNLCRDAPTPLCWYAEDQQFTELASDTQVTLALPDGSWSLVLNAPGGGIAGTLRLTGSRNAAFAAAAVAAAGFGGLLAMQAVWPTTVGAERVLPSPAMQVPSSLPLLTPSSPTCLQACSRFAGCLANHCGAGGYSPAALSSLFVTCASACNDNSSLPFLPFSDFSCAEVRESTHGPAPLPLPPCPSAPVTMPLCPCHYAPLHCHYYAPLRSAPLAAQIINATADSLAGFQCSYPPNSTLTTGVGIQPTAAVTPMPPFSRSAFSHPLGISNHCIKVRNVFLSALSPCLLLADFCAIPSPMLLFSHLSSARTPSQPFSPFPRPFLPILTPSHSSEEGSEPLGAGSTGCNATSIWTHLGSTDSQRITSLHVAVARALYTAVKDDCLVGSPLFSPRANPSPPSPPSPPSSPSSPSSRSSLASTRRSTRPSSPAILPPVILSLSSRSRLAAFLCVLFAGEEAARKVPECKYTSSWDGRQLVSASELAADVPWTVALNQTYHLSRDQAARFVLLLTAALKSVVLLPDDDVADAARLLHALDAVVVDQSLPSCGTTATGPTVMWGASRQPSTVVPVGERVTWVWADGQPHAINVAGFGDAASTPFYGMGSGRLVLSADVACSAENVGTTATLINGSHASTADPAPCPTTSAAASSPPIPFSYTTVRWDSWPGRSTVPVLRDRFGQTKEVSDRVLGGDGRLGWAVGGRWAVGGDSLVRSDEGDSFLTLLPLPPLSLSTYLDCMAPLHPACCMTSAIGDGLSFPFTLDMFSNATSAAMSAGNATSAAASAANATSAAAPGAAAAGNASSANGTEEVALSRFVAEQNRVLIGLKIEQTRWDAVTCQPYRFSSLFQNCMNRISTAPFGVNPHFLPSSSLYLPDAYVALNDSLTSADVDTMQPIATRPDGVPYGFQVAKANERVFPVIFDINLDNEAATQRLQYLADSFFIDNATQSVSVAMLTYNGDSSLFVYTTVKLNFEIGGKIAVTYNVDPVDVELYSSSADWVRLTVSVLYVCAVVWNLIEELVEAFQCWLETGRITSYFRTLWNWLDVLSLTIQFIGIIMWFIISVQMAGGFQVQPRYDIYVTGDSPFVWRVQPRYDIYVTGDSPFVWRVGRIPLCEGRTTWYTAQSGILHRVVYCAEWYTAQSGILPAQWPLLFSPCTSLTASPSPTHLPPSSPQQLQYPPVGYEQAQAVYESIRNLVQWRSILVSLQGINVFLFLLRLLKLMDFQPRIAILTRTMAAAFPALVHFFLLWAIMFIGFSLYAYVVFGRTLEQFSTVAMSMVSCFLILINDNSTGYYFIQLEGWNLTAAIIFWVAYISVMVFVMLNVLIAIVVDAFLEVRKSTEESPAFPVDMWYVLRNVLLRLSTDYWKPGRLQRHLLMLGAEDVDVT
ncbi:unnamed protein product, partial [Closterium sp. NIES-65]